MNYSRLTAFANTKISASTLSKYWNNILTSTNKFILRTATFCDGSIIGPGRNEVPPPVDGVGEPLRDPTNPCASLLALIAGIAFLATWLVAPMVKAMDLMFTIVTATADIALAFGVDAVAAEASMFDEKLIDFVSSCCCGCIVFM